MKIVPVLLWLLASSSALAGNYYEMRINRYDPVSGLYYKAVGTGSGEHGFLSKSSGGEVINLNIFDPSTGISNLIFKEPQQDGITVVLFETGFKDGSIEFNGSPSSGLVLNNSMLQKREPKNRLLVGVRNKKNDELVLFVSDKRGNGLSKLVTIPETADWHIDAKNSKLRVVHQSGQELKIESYDW